MSKGKKKLTKGQLRRVRANQSRRLKGGDEPQWDNDSLGPQLTGRVISRFGQHADVEDDQGEIFRCNLRRTINSLVVGDAVAWRKGAEQLAGIAGVIEAVHPRRSQLARPDYYDGLKVVAANIDQILVVSAVVPELSSQIIDRYLVAAEDTGIPPVLVLNKVDLLDDEGFALVEEILEPYRDIGYPIYLVSSQTGEGMAELADCLKDKISIFVGQSGVGKSSMINQLLPDAELLTGDVSSNSGLGQHTTTTARLLHFTDGGDLIDSPGVREFALWHLAPERVTWGFKEFREVLGTCKFRDCKHGDDPGCALRAAVEAGQISTQRFDNYHRILETMNTDKPNRHFGNPLTNK
ncbi:ribosome small subunit-dependent GTPase A [Ferrimonas balearica DSM 9799]|uniref:Small ribosomal subunit biogenesis GTPase RsgA n=1 Tax=Ferrimonas balearica (strain DSM 9799 / CCM 4581 / KCTC 23876 / PAT) TaxID=550540 RepID=E1SPQ7_FERBD|nr:small ribosomal subunit biogenesis GTPase RsgA [Ferrimonas balearica]ADN74721.1 ribosome small subunit-dependent GTPase A [Ferrimonas balearica DSM 9799]